jgi:hypothetical protein
VSDATLADHRCFRTRDNDVIEKPRNPTSTARVGFETTRCRDAWAKMQGA